MKKILLVACGFVLSTSLFAASMQKEDSMKKMDHKMSDMKKMDKMDKMMPAFGSKKDVEYSKYLWQELEKAKLNSTPATLYVGGPPHGKVREVLEGMIDNQRVIVKRNFGGPGVSIDTVSKNRAKYLKAVTVMIQRKAYDVKNNDWFWVKYKADGSLHTAPNKLQLTGKVKGCISCHSSASGNDLVFAHNKEANAEITLVNEMMK